MTSKELTAQNIIAKIKRLPQFIKSDFHSAVPKRNDQLLHSSECPKGCDTDQTQTIQTRRAKTVSGPRSPHREIKLELGVLSDNSLHNFYRGFSDDVEAGGIFAATLNIQPVGTVVTVCFELPGNRKISTRGVVQYTREVSSRAPFGCMSGMGISFSCLENADKTAIEQFQEKCPPICFEV